MAYGVIMADMFKQEFPPRHARPKAVDATGSFTDRFFGAGGMPPVPEGAREEAIPEQPTGRAFSGILGGFMSAAGIEVPEIDPKQAQD